LKPILDVVLSLIPISDANPTRKFPVVTVAIIAINIAVWVFVEPGWGLSKDATFYFYQHAPVPCQLDHSCPIALFQETGGNAAPSFGQFVLLLINSSFFHAGVLHIGGNMLFLWVFGNNIEDYLGRVKFIIFYLLGAIASGLAHILFALSDPALPVGQIAACLNGASDVCNGIGRYVPSVGASGAVAAVMGAYLVLYPRARVNVLVPIFIIFTVIQMSAFVVLGLWFVYQFLIGAPDLANVGGNTTVAWMAHVGGFVFGAVAIFLLGGRPQDPEPLWVRQYRP
jgi:membrane associated rhomboid family serine protease